MTEQRRRDARIEQHRVAARFRLDRSDPRRYYNQTERHGRPLVLFDRAGVVRPGPLASPDGGFRDHIRIAYGAEPERLSEAVDRLAAAWAEYAPAARRFTRASLAVSV